MKKRRNIIIGCALVLLFGMAGAALWVRLSAPPGEEWISYRNDEVTASIDRQLEGLDMDEIISGKESLVLEKDVKSLQQTVASGELTYEELTAICLYRIKALDQSFHGYNSVMEIAPDAMEQARARDDSLAGLLGGVDSLPPLYGIPVMLKDNINTADMPTSAGAAAFTDFVPDRDAVLVQTLREQGAVILGKNNLSEFAYYVARQMPSGYSGKKGQTVNPFGPLKISPSGSSSGSAVAVTANLVPISIGTETAGSIAGPASVNSVVGFKPTRGSISGEGIFPLVRSVDTPGPIAKTVQDAAWAYAALSGDTLPGKLDASALEGRIVGLAAYDYNDAAMIQNIRSALEAAGARVTDISIDQTGVQVQNIIELTFKRDFEEYTRQYGFPITSLDELVRFNTEDTRRRAKYGQDHLEAAAAVNTPDDSPVQASILNAQKQLDALFSVQGLDAIVFLNTTVSTVVAAAGYPELTVPAGLDGKGVPQGATFAAGYGEDWKLLAFGYAFEQAAQGRRVPNEQS